jgi:hypothetical protein
MNLALERQVGRQQSLDTISQRKASARPPENTRNAFKYRRKPFSIYNPPRLPRQKSRSILGGTLATTIIQSAYVPSPAAGRRYDHLFFSAMALLILLAVFIGFARSYYLAGVFQAPLPNRLVHIHGAVFTCWILLLVTQTLLISAHRVDIHRRLGLVGFGLACIMPVLAILTAIDALVRHANLPAARAFFAIPTFDILAFMPLIFFSWKYRSKAATHKRLILIATIAILDAAVARWPVHASWWGLQPAIWAADAFLLPLFAYDLFSIRKIHRATLWGSASFLFLQHIRGPIGNSETWQTLAAWIQHGVR